MTTGFTDEEATKFVANLTPKVPVKFNQVKHVSGSNPLLLSLAVIQDTSNVEAFKREYDSQVTHKLKNF